MEIYFLIAIDKICMVSKVAWDILHYSIMLSLFDYMNISKLLNITNHVSIIL